jgi:hypothetical protein
MGGCAVRSGLGGRGSGPKTAKCPEAIAIAVRNGFRGLRDEKFQVSGYNGLHGREIIAADRS